MAITRWLYDADAVETPDRAIPMPQFFTTEHALFYGLHFTVDDADQAAAWLRRHSLIDGSTVDSFQGPVTAYLTDAGFACVERFNGDPTAYVEAMERPTTAPQTVTWNVSGENVQVATGDKARQVMNIGPNVEHIAAGLEGMVELLRAVGVTVDEEVETLRDQAVADVRLEQPTGEPAKRFVRKVQALAAAGATGSITAAITAGGNALVEDVEHLVRALAGG